MVSAHGSIGEQGQQRFWGNVEGLCRRYPPRLPYQRPRHCSKTPKDRSPAPQGQVCKATGRRLASASRGRERGKRGFAAAGRRCFPLFTDAIKFFDPCEDREKLCYFVINKKRPSGPPNHRVRWIRRPLSFPIITCIEPKSFSIFSRAAARRAPTVREAQTHRDP